MRRVTLSAAQPLKGRVPHHARRPRRDLGWKAWRAGSYGDLEGSPQNPWWDPATRWVYDQGMGAFDVFLETLNDEAPAAPREQAEEAEEAEVRPRARPRSKAVKSPKRGEARANAKTGRAVVSPARRSTKAGNTVGSPARSTRSTRREDA